jgi:hypothetical protein
MFLFPTEQWLAEYGRRLTGSEALDTVAAGWGTEFNGDLLVVIEDLPLEETTVGDLPPEVLERIPSVLTNYVPPLSDLTLAQAPEVASPRVRWLLPERTQDLLRQLEESVVDGTIYAFIELEDGVCTGVETLGGPTERAAGVVIRGSYETWHGVITSERFVSAVLHGGLELDGNRRRLVQYLSAVGLLGEIAADVPTTPLFLTDGRTPPGPEGTREGLIHWVATRSLDAHRRIAERVRDSPESARTESG